MRPPEEAESEPGALVIEVGEQRYLLAFGAVARIGTYTLSREAGALVVRRVGGRFCFVGDSELRLEAELRPGDAVSSVPGAPNELVVEPEGFEPASR